MFYSTSFAMHQFFGMHHFSAICVNDALVTQTDAQCWDGWAECLQDSFTDAEELLVLRVAGSRRDDYAVRLEFGSFLQLDLVVSINICFCALLTNVLDQVVNEGIVVIND